MTAELRQAPGDSTELPESAGLRPTAQKDQLYRYLQEEFSSLQEEIEQLENKSVAGGERQDAIDHCLAGISRLSTEVQDASSSLTAYDQRTYSQAVKALSEKLQETRTKIAPKSRFAFKTTQKNSSAISLNDAAQLAVAQGAHLTNRRFDSSTESSVASTPADLQTPPGETDAVGDLPSFPKNYNEEISRPGGAVRKPSFSQASNVLISGHTGLHIILPNSAAHATSSGSLIKLNRCIVDMSVPTVNGAPFMGLTMNNIKNSLIVAGQVAGAAHITGVENSVIAVASRQVRMHECKNVDIYLQCGSRPIIEDCANVRFAPLPECYAVSQDPPINNQWDQVDDFKWLKEEHSPNWSVLPEDKRLNEGLWKTEVPGGPGISLQEILNKMGVKGQ